MPWHRVVHSCGHIDSHDLTGSRRDRERTAQWRSRQPCRRCYKRGLAEAAAAWCAAQGLPPLIGRAAERRAGEQARAAALRPHLEVADTSVLGWPASLVAISPFVDLTPFVTRRLRSLAAEVRAWRVTAAAEHIDPQFWSDGGSAFATELRDGWGRAYPARHQWLVEEIEAAHARRAAARAARDMGPQRLATPVVCGEQVSDSDGPGVLRVAAGRAEAELRGAESRVAEAAQKARAEARRVAAARRRAAAKARPFPATVTEPEIPRIAATQGHGRVPRSA